VAHWARQYEFVESIRFCLLAVSIPALLVAGAPWRWLGLASRETYVLSADEISRPQTKSGWFDRLATARRGRSGDRQAYVLATLFCATAIFWRTTAAVDAVVSHAWLAPVESVVLVSVGVLLWMDLIESPPMKPGATRPFRIGMAAVCMWTVWVLAYLGAMSGNSWYPSFLHLAGHGLSLAADQQLSTGFMWLLPAGAFLPVVFWNLSHWLQSEENPDDELIRIMRKERMFGTIDTKH
jgi:cytochrome c oxidase assembly factor CtaG